MPITVAIEAGPLMSGIARGKDAISDAEERNDQARKAWAESQGNTSSVDPSIAKAFCAVRAGPQVVCPK
jgi:hypothetical protein